MFMAQYVHFLSVILFFDDLPMRKFLRMLLMHFWHVYKVIL